MKPAHAEREPSRNGRFSVLQLGTSVVLAALLGGGVGGAIVEASADKPPAPVSVPSRADIQREALRAATKAEQAHDSAVALAKSYEATLNAHESIYNMQVLNGSIDIVDPDGAHHPAYINPIILGYIAPHTKLKDFSLEGVWIGVQGSDEKGNIVITPALLDDSYEVTIYNNPDELLIPDITVYSAVAKGGPGQAVHELYAAKNGARNALVNSDGLPVMPGRSVGMK